MKHLGTKTLKTERLVLRQFKEEDAQAIYNNFINKEKIIYYANQEKTTLKSSLISKKYVKMIKEV